jgi:hypothetical protein
LEKSENDENTEVFEAAAVSTFWKTYYVCVRLLS